MNQQAPIEQIKSKLVKLEQLAEDMKGPRWRDVLKAVRLIVHQISGISLASGNNEGSRSALTLMEMTNLLMGNPAKILSNQQVESFLSSVVKFRNLLDSDEKKTEKNFYDLSEEIDLLSNKIVYVLDEKNENNEHLIKQMSYYGYKAELVKTRESLLEKVELTPPACIVVGDSRQPLAFKSTNLKIQQGRDNNIPMILMSADDSAKIRLHGIQAKFDAFFSKPVDPSRLIDKIDALVTNKNKEPFKVLIIDDSQAQAMFHSSVLAQAGIEAVICSNPLDVMQPLIEFQPDLVLLDMYMPDFQGPELAAMIRQHDAFVSMPVVYLSSETNEDKRVAAMKHGGDDFLTKPIKPDHLVSTLTTKIERARIMREFMLCDSLTGLYNHTTTKKMLEAELSRAVRHNQSLCFAMIDIDKFKSVNDTYGHPSGDRVIKSLARLLKQSLRKSDIVGRYGGEEFAVILPQTDEASAEKIMNRIRENFSRILHYAEGGEVSFTSSFSCGISGRTPVTTAREMNIRADSSLYDAKRGGRNLVKVSEV